MQQACDHSDVKSLSNVCKVHFSFPLFCCANTRIAPTLNQYQADSNMIEAANRLSNGHGSLEQCHFWIPNILHQAMRVDSHTQSGKQCVCSYTRTFPAVCLLRATPLSPSLNTEFHSVAAHSANAFCLYQKFS